MLDKEGLVEYMKRVGFRNLQQTETDYLQHMLLGAMYSLPNSNGLVFKGGTALQKLYGIDRFSIDLDFTTALGKDAITAILGKVADRMRMYGAESQFVIEEAQQNNSVSSTFKIRGPVYRSTNDERSVATIRLDFSGREGILLDSIRKLVTPIYPELMPYTVNSMNPQEILAEKFRAVMTRRKARDTYDFDFLIRKKFDLFYNLVEKKMALYGMHDLSIDAFLKRVRSLGADVWKQEIRNIVYASKGVDSISSPEGFNSMYSRIEAYLKNVLSFKVEFDTAQEGIRSNKGKTVYGSLYTFIEMGDVIGSMGQKHIYTKDNYEASILVPSMKTEGLHLTFEVDGKGDAIPLSVYHNGMVGGAYRIEKGHNFSLSMFVEDTYSVTNEKIAVGLLLKPI